MLYNHTSERFKKYIIVYHSSLYNIYSVCIDSIHWIIGRIVDHVKFIGDT